MPPQLPQRLPQVVAGTVDRYLKVADRLLPGRISGLYVVGSTALGAFRPGHSDIDAVVVVDRPLAPADVRRLRLVHVGGNAAGAVRAARHRQWAIPGTVNAVYVAATDLDRPVSALPVQASHTGYLFHPGSGFDVNPVMWKVFAEHGIAVRGPAPTELALDPEPARLREWNRSNLRQYWRGWGEAVLRRRHRPLTLSPARWFTAWGVLGPPRLHHTIATGEVISKEAAGEYALDTFASRWHPIVREGLAFWRDEPANPAFADPTVRRQVTAEFVLAVVADAEVL